MSNMLFFIYRPKQLFLLLLQLYTFCTRKYTISRDLSKSGNHDYHVKSKSDHACASQHANQHVTVFQHVHVVPRFSTSLRKNMISIVSLAHIQHVVYHLLVNPCIQSHFALIIMLCSIILLRPMQDDFIHQGEGRRSMAY